MSNNKKHSTKTTRSARQTTWFHVVLVTDNDCYSTVERLEGGTMDDQLTAALAFSLERAGLEYGEVRDYRIFPFLSRAVAEVREQEKHDRKLAEMGEQFLLLAGATPAELDRMERVDRYRREVQNWLSGEELSLFDRSDNEDPIQDRFMSHYESCFTLGLSERECAHRWMSRVN